MCASNQHAFHHAFFGGYRRSEIPKKKKKKKTGSNKLSNPSQLESFHSIKGHDMV
ncbi:uncharacterized protein DS421_13g402450 [Arachis hypogaea]|nr:uncharacterized protein DS421_13g402450 [Arachis hypogaea]